MKNSLKHVKAKYACKKTDVSPYLYKVQTKWLLNETLISVSPKLIIF